VPARTPLKKEIADKEMKDDKVLVEMTDTPDAATELAALDEDLAIEAAEERYGMYQSIGKLEVDVLDSTRRTDYSDEDIASSAEDRLGLNPT